MSSQIFHRPPDGNTEDYQNDRQDPRSPIGGQHREGDDNHRNQSPRQDDQHQGIGKDSTRAQGIIHAAWEGRRQNRLRQCLGQPLSSSQQPDEKRGCDDGANPQNRVPGESRGKVQSHCQKVFQAASYYGVDPRSGEYDGCQAQGIDGQEPQRPEYSFPERSCGGRVCLSGSAAAGGAWWSVWLIMCVPQASCA